MGKTFAAEQRGPPAVQEQLRPEAAELNLERPPAGHSGTDHILGTTYWSSENEMTEVKAKVELL